MTTDTTPSTGLSEENRKLVDAEFPEWAKREDGGYWAMKPVSLNRLLDAARAQGPAHD